MTVGTYWYMLCVGQREACFALAEAAPPPSDALRRRLNALRAPSIDPNTDFVAALPSALEQHIRDVQRELADATGCVPIVHLFPQTAQGVDSRSAGFDDDSSVHLIWFSDDSDDMMRLSFPASPDSYRGVVACCTAAILLFVIVLSSLQ